MKALIVAGVVLCCACGGGGGNGSVTGSATLTGSVGGQSFTPHDATAAVLSFSANGVPGRAAVIAITSASGLCPLVADGKEPKSTTYLVLSAFQIQPDHSAAPPPSPGTYSVGSLAIENGVAVFAGTDSACALVAPAKRASTGTINLTSVGNRYSGSYDLFFDFGEHVSGIFDAPVCTGVSTLDPTSGALACQ
jgi:hypothetical protein